MALIEHLEQDNWQDFLRGSFEYTLEVLKNDRFRSVGSSVDDLRSVGTRWNQASKGAPQQPDGHAAFLLNQEGGSQRVLGTTRARESTSALGLDDGRDPSSN